ncbi:MAG: DNA translocase FtsK [Bacteroidales bacterium]|nr:DNA translocase FtsK [Bacteroidales bacterium]
MFNNLITRLREGSDPEKRRRIVKICGILMAVFTVFSLVATVSYLFTWKTDQSLLNDPQMMDASIKVSNAAGKIGYQWSHLLVARWFGLGAFAFILVLAILTVRMLLGTRPFSVIKAVLLSLTAAFLSSFILAFFSGMASADTFFGGGLGGECGAYVIRWAGNLVGSILTFCILAALVALWTLVASKRFSGWFLSLGDAAPEVVDCNDEPVEAKPKRGFTFVEKLGREIEAELNAETAPEPEAELQSEPEPAEEPVARPVMAEPVAAAAAPAESDGLEVVAGEELSTDVYEELPRIDVRSELENYRFPPLDLLDDYENGRHEVPQEELKRNNYKIRATLKTYKIDVDNVKAVVGPTVTLYKVYPAPGVKISAIRNLQDDIAMALKAKGVRVVTLEDSVGIEVANDHPSIVPLKAMLNDASFRDSKAELPVAIGYTITQKVKVFDLADAPHLLVAGATKQGKSVGLNVLISSLLYSKHPSELKFVFIDPKMVEFSAYSRLIKHYLAVLPDAASEQDEIQNAIAKTPKQAETYLKSLCVEMDERYELLSKALVNKITLYNEKYKSRHLRPDQGHRYMPYIVVVVDEYADLTMSVGGGPESKTVARSIMTSIIRLAQKGRAAGIHVVLATQRPSVDVVNGLIKSNFPTRIAFRVFSSVDSKTILDAPGADKLIGKGDMIYLSGVDNERIQCAYISNDEINTINDFIGRQQGYKKSFNTPYYLPAPEPDSGEEGVAMIDMKALDERFEEAARLVVTSQRGSTSDLQRKLGMGYAKAGRVMDQLEAAGIVGPQEGSKPRQVLVSTFEELDRIVNAFKNQQ